MRFPIVIAAFLMIHSSPAAAQACPPAAPNGAPAWFDFQVEQRARFVRSDSLLPFPDASLDRVAPFPSDFAVVQFVVDTTGVPVPRTLRILRHPEGLVADAVNAGLTRWRFEPAMVRGCRVPQLVQSALRWK